MGPQKHLPPNLPSLLTTRLFLVDCWDKATTPTTMKPNREYVSMTLDNEQTAQNDHATQTTQQVQVIRHSPEQMKREVQEGRVQITTELTVDPNRSLRQLKRDVVEYAQTHTLHDTMIMAGGTLSREFPVREQGITLAMVVSWLWEQGLRLTEHQQDELDRAWDLKCSHRDCEAAETLDIIDDVA